VGMALGGCLLGPCDGVGVSTSGHKGVQGGARVVGGRGQGAEHTKSGEKREKKEFEYAQKCDLLVVLCVCSRRMGRRFAGVA